jgi:hypothetical protein
MDYGILRKLFVTEIALLFVQFGIGMSGNLFVIIPINGSFDFFGYSGGIDVLAHMVNGFLILLFAFLIIWYSYKAKNPLILRLSMLAVALTLTAIVCGIVFLESFSFPSLYNVGNDFSMAMAMSFLFIFAIFFSELYLTKNA